MKRLEKINEAKENFKIYLLEYKKSNINDEELILSVGFLLKEALKEVDEEILKAKEEGKKEAIEKISASEGWEESEEHYKKLLLNK